MKIEDVNKYVKTAKTPELEKLVITINGVLKERMLMKIRVGDQVTVNLKNNYLFREWDKKPVKVVGIPQKTVVTIETPPRAEDGIKRQLDTSKKNIIDVIKGKK